MTRQTRKTFSTSGTSDNTTDDKWGQPVLAAPPSDTAPTGFEGVILPSDLFEATYGRRPDKDSKVEWDEALKLYYAHNAGKASQAINGTAPLPKARRTFWDATPEHTTFATDCEDTPVPLAKLLEILAFQRFAGSKGEEDMIDAVIIPLKGIQHDQFGNYWLRIPNADGSDSATLFSCHTDTVEKAKAKGLKELELKGAMLTTKGGGVLGADDGAGIWLVLNLIQAGIPGLYIFHREEEIGGGGSSWIAAKNPQMLDGIKRAIAFDRKDLNHIITHQGGERCCSEAFSKAFGAMLNDACEGFDFHSDDGGSFTDTKNYTELVAECTNLSVGYYDQHTQHECQDLSFLTRLANALIKVEWEVLPTERDPKEVDDRWGAWKRQGSVLRGTSFFTDDDEEDEKMADLILDYPCEVMQILKDCGYDVFGLEDEIDRQKLR